MSDEIPLFLLGTVLFPGGVLALRVFETRYVDMVRERLRAEAPFGVCRITRGAEVGEVAEHEPVGCTARIIDWDMPQPGVLGIRAVGGERFGVLDSRIERGLVRARIEPIAPDARAAPPEPLAPCVELLRRGLARLSAIDAGHTVLPPYEFDSAGWVANRLAELLPLPAEQRQQLMELRDPVERLRQVDALLHEQATRPDPGAQG